MIGVVGTILALALSQQQALTPPSPLQLDRQQMVAQENRRMVTVFHRGRVLTINASAARSMLRLTTDPAFKAALELALMIRSHHCDHTPKDSEVECFDR